MVNMTTVSDISGELCDFEKEVGLLPTAKDRWVFRFAKDYFIVFGKDHKRMVLSARNPDEVVMVYSYLE